MLELLFWPGVEVVAAHEHRLPIPLEPSVSVGLATEIGLLELQAPSGEEPYDVP